MPRISLQTKKNGALTVTVEEVVAELRRLATPKILHGLSRYGLPADKALGVPMHAIQKLGKQIGRQQALAEELWRTDIYEARLLVAYIAEPEKLTSTLMNRWCADFDNWTVVDTLCFKLFDQTSHAWSRIRPWAAKKGEFQRRAGYVLIACLAAHADDTGDKDFLPLLPLLETGATDERNFVKKGVSWALRMVGRQSPVLKNAVTELAQRLVVSENGAARWVGRDTLRDLAKVKRTARS